MIFQTFAQEFHGQAIEIALRKLTVQETSKEPPIPRSTLECLRS